MNKNEIVIGNHIYMNGGVELKVGDKINIGIGKRQTPDGHELKGINPYDEEEEIVDAKSYEFTIVRYNRKTSI